MTTAEKKNVESAEIEINRAEAMLILAIFNQCIEQHGAPPLDIGIAITQVTMRLDEKFGFGFAEGLASEAN